MSSSRDHYEVLGVDRSATSDEIRRAHRKLARQYHPDVNKDPSAAQRFAEAQAAYDTLSDPERRAQYDRFGHDSPFGGAGGAAGSTGAQGSAGSWRVEVDPADFASVFEDYFEQRGGPFGAGPRGGRSGAGRAARASRGTDIEQAIDIDFTTAALGGTRVVHVHGGTAGESRLDVRIPTGVDQGGVLRIGGHGRPGRGGGPAGDLLLTINVAPHPWFRRSGNDIALEVPISITEAALGCTVTVPLLRGTVDLKVPPGTSSGRRLRVRGQGIPDRAGAKGDFHAIITIVAPESLTADDRAALSTLGERLPNPRVTAPWASAVEKSA